MKPKNCRSFISSIDNVAFNRNHVARHDHLNRMNVAAPANPLCGCVSHELNFRSYLPVHVEINDG